MPPIILFEVDRDGEIHVEHDRLVEGAQQLGEIILGALGMQSAAVTMGRRVIESADGKGVAANVVAGLKPDLAVDFANPTRGFEIADVEAAIEEVQPMLGLTLRGMGKDRLAAEHLEQIRLGPQMGVKVLDDARKFSGENIPELYECLFRSRIHQQEREAFFSVVHVGHELTPLLILDPSIDQPKMIRHP